MPEIWNQKETTGARKADNAQEQGVKRRQGGGEPCREGNERLKTQRKEGARHCPRRRRWPSDLDPGRRPREESPGHTRGGGEEVSRGREICGRTSWRAEHPAVGLGGEDREPAPL